MADLVPKGSSVGFAIRTALSTHRIFAITVLAKGVLGLLQLAISAALYFGVLQNMPRTALWQAQKELAEDPNDFIASHILSLASYVPTTNSEFLTIYFAAHGFLHVAIVAALLWGARWSNHAAIIVLGIFVVCQSFEWASISGKMLLVLSAIDLAVIYLTIRENSQRKQAT